jgi:hypothetical protein
VASSSCQCASYKEEMREGTRPDGLVWKQKGRGSVGTWRGEEVTSGWFVVAVHNLWMSVMVAVTCSRVQMTRRGHLGQAGLVAVADEGWK